LPFLQKEKKEEIILFFSVLNKKFPAAGHLVFSVVDFFNTKFGPFSALSWFYERPREVETVTIETTNKIVDGIQNNGKAD